MKMLIASTHLDLVTAVSSALTQMSIQPEVCTRASMATDMVRNSRLEGLIVDTTDSTFSDLIKIARSESSNRTAAIVAVVARGEVGQAFRQGATFAVEHPFTNSAMSRTLSACYSLMVRERRRYFRCPVVVPITVKGSHPPEIHTMTANISEGGLAFCSPVPADFHACELQFKLPELRTTFKIRAEVRWQSKIHTGVRFAYVPYDQKIELREWLDRMSNQVGYVVKPRHQSAALPSIHPIARCEAPLEILSLASAGVSRDSCLTWRR